MLLGNGFQLVSCRPYVRFLAGVVGCAPPFQVKFWPVACLEV